MYKSLSEIDFDFNTTFNQAFSNSTFSDFVDYVEANFLIDYKNFNVVKNQFDGFLNKSNNTLIPLNQLTQFIEMKTFRKLSFLQEFVFNQFQNNKANFNDEETVNFQTKIVNITNKLREYMTYFSKNHDQILKYIRYQNHINSGADYIKFEEFN